MDILENSMPKYKQQFKEMEAQLRILKNQLCLVKSEGSSKKDTKGFIVLEEYSNLLHQSLKEDIDRVKQENKEDIEALCKRVVTAKDQQWIETKHLKTSISEYRSTMNKIIEENNTIRLQHMTELKTNNTETITNMLTDIMTGKVPSEVTPC